MTPIDLELLPDTIYKCSPLHLFDFLVLMFSYIEETCSTVFVWSMYDPYYKWRLALDVAPIYSYGKLYYYRFGYKCIARLQVLMFWWYICVQMYVWKYFPNRTNLYEIRLVSHLCIFPIHIAINESFSYQPSKFWN